MVYFVRVQIFIKIESFIRSESLSARDVALVRRNLLLDLVPNNQEHIYLALYRQLHGLFNQIPSALALGINQGAMLLQLLNLSFAFYHL